MNSTDFSRMTVADYRTFASGCTMWDPNPFAPHPDGPWHEREFPDVVKGVTSLLARFDASLVNEQQLLRGKDNDKRPGPNALPLCHDTLSYWLYFQHHPGHEYWKLIGQIYWSVEAYLSWYQRYARTSPEERFGRNGRPSLKTLPKGGPNGLVSEHVVPKKAMKRLLLPTRDPDRIVSALRLNLCCVVTGAENYRLARADHPNPAEPWQRYRDKEIVLLHNPNWTDAEIDALLRNGLLSLRSIWPFASRSASR